MEYTRVFKDIHKEDVALAGGKGASLGEMINVGIPVPNGYVVLASAFEEFIKETGLLVEIDAILDTVRHEEVHTVEYASEQIQALIINAVMPKKIKQEIVASFGQLGSEFVAVRSSATSEDSAAAAWAGQLDSFLNTTRDEVVANVQRCWASLFTPRAIFYRFEKGLHGTAISVAVVVQKMVNSEESGIAFSVHPVTQDYNQLIIEAGFGLGEAIVSGAITPDSYVVDKRDFSFIDITVNEQTRGLFRNSLGGNEWRKLGEKGRTQVLCKEEITELSKLIVHIENHYGFPCDIEWAKESGKFYIVQSRPITTLTSKSEREEKEGQKRKESSSEESHEQLNALIEKIKNEAILFNYPGSIFYVSHAFYWSTDATLRKFGTAQPYMLVYFENYTAHGESPIYAGFGEEIFRRLDDDPKEFVTTVKKENEVYRERIESFIENNDVDKPNASLSYYLDLIKESADMLIDAVTWFNSCLVVDRYFEKIRDTLFKDHNLELTHEELISIGLSQEPPAVLLRDSCILEYIQYLRNHNLTQASYAEVEKHKGALAGLKKCYSLGYYQCAGYGGVTLWTLEDEFNLVKEHLKDTEQLEAQVRERDVYAKKFRNLWKRVSKDDELRFWIEAFIYFSYMRDLRKVMEQKMWYFQARCLEKISTFVNIPREDLEYLGVTEFTQEFLDRPDLNEIIAARKDAFLWVWSKETGHLFFSGDKAHERYKRYSIESKIEKSDSTELKGFPASLGKARGRARVVFNAHHTGKFEKGSILVTSMTTPEFVPLMKQSAAIITELGGLTCHAAIVARELKKPCIIGIDRVTQLLRDGDLIEVDADKGIVRIIKRA